MPQNVKEFLQFLVGRRKRHTEGRSIKHKAPINVKEEPGRIIRALYVYRGKAMQAGSHGTPERISR